jgi:HEAT repeat protein
METSDRTSQEYQTALAINDWDYFLPRNHLNSPVEGKEYRIFQPQWKQIILFWLGRDDIDSEEKEAFIQKLVDFDDGCGEWSYINADKGFYEYQSYFLAAAGINVFKECSLSDEIVEQIVKWGFGYFNIEKQKWITFIDPIGQGARIVLAETIREKVITNLIQVLETSDFQDYTYSLEYFYWIVDIFREIAIENELAIRELIGVLETTEDENICWDVSYSLGEIAVGNELAIQALIQILETSKYETNRRIVAESLGKIDPGNKLAIQALIQILETSKDGNTRRSVVYSLEEIGVGNELAIGALIQVLETTKDKETRRRVASSLGKIAIRNELAIGALIQVSEATKDGNIRTSVAYSLGESGVGNELAIGALIQVLEATESLSTGWMVAESLGKIAVENELAIQKLIQILETTKDKETRGRVAYSLGEIVVGNELAIGALIQVLETTEDRNTGWIVASSLGKIAIRNELAIRELIRVLRTTKDEDTRRSVAENLGKIDPGNKLAIGALIQVLETTKDKETRWSVAENLGKIDPGNKLAIGALIQLLKTTMDEDTHRWVASSLGKIGHGNELAIRELIQVLENTFCSSTRRSVAESLGEIAVGNELAIGALIRVLQITKYTNSIRWEFVHSLGKIIKTEKQYLDGVFALKHNLTDEVYENDFDLFEKFYELPWKCAQNLPYPKFYQAWHHNTFTPNANNNNYPSEGSEESQRSFASMRSAQDDIIKNSEITNNTPVGNTLTLQQFEQQITDICSQLPHLPVHCINVNKLLTLNTESKFVQAFCNRLYQKLLPDKTIPKVQTVTDLERKIIHLKQQLQTPHLFILLLADGTPTPEVLDCCDYLTDVLHLGWITPDPLPLPPPQRSFVASQENLLKAVESWVAEY